jgi:hypothetical protein
MVLVTYEIHYPCGTTDPGEQPPPPASGALEMTPSEGAKLRLRDVAAQWPFAGAFHFRAQYSPPAEPHVFLDMPDANMPLPVAPDGIVALRALPLDFLGGVPRGRAPGEAWAWGEAELAAFRSSRSSSSSSSGSGSGGGAEGGASPSWGSSGGSGGGSGGGGGGGDSPCAAEEAGGSSGREGAWSDLDGGFQEGGPSIGAGRGGTLAEAAEEGLAQAAAAAVAARDAAGEAAGAALSAAKKMFSGWGAAMKGVLGKGSASSGAGAGEQ